MEGCDGGGGASWLTTSAAILGRSFGLTGITGAEAATGTAS